MVKDLGLLIALGFKMFKNSFNGAVFLYAQWVFLRILAYSI